MLFKSQQLNDELKKNGYVIIPFLPEKSVTELNGFYNSVHEGKEPPTFIDNIHMTSWCTDGDYKRKVSAGIKNITGKAASQLFNHYRSLNHVFIVKRSGPQTNFKVHQDWNVVDENIHESVNVWVPLHDVDEDSGALWILKGSHAINRKIRGAGYLFPDYSAHLDLLQTNAISIKLKAGQAVVFYHSTIHGSPPNISGSHRKAACFSIIPESAPLCIYFQPSRGSNLGRYEPSDDFMFNYDYLRTDTFDKPPAPEPLEVYDPYINNPVTENELMPFIGKKRKSFFSIFIKNSKNR